MSNQVMENRLTEVPAQIVDEYVPVVESITRAEIDVAIATANRFPRSIEKFQAEAERMVTQSEEVAKACIFSKPQGKDILNGPSIRFYEIIAMSFRNLRTGARVIEINRETMEIITQGVCHDLESNISTSVEYRRSIRDKYGKLYSEQMIQLNASAACAIAYRMAVKRIIPEAFTNPIYKAACKTATGDASTLSARVKKALESFLKMGISEERVLNAIKREDVQSVTMEDFTQLIGLYNAIKEGETPIEEAFPIVRTANPVEGLKERIKNGHQEPAQPTESDESGEDSKENPPQDEPEKSSLTEKDGSPGPKKYVKPDKPKPDLDAQISEDQKVELQEIIHEDSISKSAVSLILESHGAKLISELRGKDFVSVKQALREVRK